MNNFRSNDRGNSGGGYRGGFSRESAESSGPSPQFQQLLGKVDLARPSVDMFDGVAQSIAKELASDGRSKNKSSQVRKFYDEVVGYSDRHRGTGHPEADKDSFERDLPFIRMICARAAYARTRDHVDSNFVAFMQDGLRKINSADELRMFRALFEAVIGFSPKSQGG